MKRVAISKVITWKHAGEVHVKFHLKNVGSQPIRYVKYVGREQGRDRKQRPVEAQCDTGMNPGDTVTAALTFPDKRVKRVEFSHLQINFDERQNLPGVYRKSLFGWRFKQ